MLKAPKVSVIIPIYNAGTYLSECLDSIATQTFSDFEAIMVDDGSTDGSGRVAAQVAENDARFKLFIQKNGGSSKARNAGLDVASGKYVVFIDADDYAEPDLLKKCFFEAEKYGSEITIFNFDTYDNETKQKSRGLVDVGRFPKGQIFRLTDIDGRSEHLRLQRFSTATTTPKFLLLRKLLDQYSIRYDEKLNRGEDTDFAIKAVTKARGMVVVDDVLFHYRTNTGVSKEDNADKHVDDYYSMFESVRSYLIEGGYWEEMEIDYYNWFSEYFLTNMINRNITTSKYLFTKYPDFLKNIKFTKRHLTSLGNVYNRDLIRAALEGDIDFSWILMHRERSLCSSMSLAINNYERVIADKDSMIRHKDDLIRHKDDLISKKDQQIESLANAGIGRSLRMLRSALARRLKLTK